MLFIYFYDLVELFLVVYENFEVLGWYFGVYDSWYWKDIYSELDKFIFGLKVFVLFEGELVFVIGFDFSCWDSFGVKVCDILVIFWEMVEWIKLEFFN